MSDSMVKSILKRIGWTAYNKLMYAVFNSGRAYGELEVIAVTSQLRSGYCRYLGQTGAGNCARSVFDFLEARYSLDFSGILDDTRYNEGRLSYSQREKILTSLARHLLVQGLVTVNVPVDKNTNTQNTLNADYDGSWEHEQYEHEQYEREQYEREREREQYEREMREAKDAIRDLERKVERTSSASYVDTEARSVRVEENIRHTYIIEYYRADDKHTRRSKYINGARSEADAIAKFNNEIRLSSVESQHQITIVSIERR